MTQARPSSLMFGLGTAEQFLRSNQVSATAANLITHTSYIYLPLAYGHWPGLDICQLSPNKSQIMNCLSEFFWQTKVVHMGSYPLHSTQATLYLQEYELVSLNPVVSDCRRRKTSPYFFKVQKSQTCSTFHRPQSPVGIVC